MIKLASYLKTRFYAVFLRCLFFCICIFSFKHSSSQITSKGLPVIKNYSYEQFNAADQCWDIIQDNRGILYVANAAGLMEFDGERWQLMTSPSELDILSMDKDPQGKIYIGGYNELGYLGADSLGKPKIILMNDKIPQDYKNFYDVFKVHCLSSDKTVFHTYNYLFLFDGNNLEILKAKSKFLSSFKINNKLYVVDENHGLYYLIEGQLKLIKGSTFLSKDRPVTILPFIKDNLLISVSGLGLFVYNGTDFTQWDIPANDVVKNYNIIDGIKYLNKYYVYATRSNGLIVLDKNGHIIQWLKADHGILSDLNHNVYEDEITGNLWLTNETGVCYIEFNSPIYFINSKIGLDTKAYAANYVNNKLYLGGYPTVFEIKWNTFSYPNNESNDISELAEFEGAVTYGMSVADNEILISGFKGLSCINNNYLYNVYKDVSAFTTAFFNNDKNSLLMFCEPGCYVVQKDKNNNVWEPKGRVKGVDLICFHATSIVENDFWMSTYKGYYRLKLNEAKDSAILLQYCKGKYGIQDADASIIQLNGTLYAFIKNHLHKYNVERDCFEIDEEVDSYSFKESSNNRYFLGTDNKSKLWYRVNENEIGMIDISSEENTRIINKTLKKIPRVTNISDAFCYINEEEIIFGSPQGAFIYNNNLNRDDKAFQAVIRKARLINENRNVFNGGYPTNDSTLCFVPKENDTPILKYNENALRFEYGCSYYENTEDNLYSYKLEGFDAEWSSWEKKAEKEYTNLPHGVYTFRVKAKNIYDVEGTEAVYKFVIKPPLWKTNLARLIFLLFFIGFLVFIHKYRIYHIEKKNRQLANIIKERTTEVHQKNEELTAQAEQLSQTNTLLVERQQLIEEQSEELKVKNEELVKQKKEIKKAFNDLQEAQIKMVQSEKMASLGILTAGVAHEINNPLNFIKSGIYAVNRMIEKGSITPDALKAILENMDIGVIRAAAIVKSLNSFSRKGDNIQVECDIYLIIENSLLILNHELKYTCEVIKNYTSESFTLIGNEETLLQVFINLLMNSVQAIKEKGIITISTKVQDTNLEIVVSDNGAGIKEEDLDHIFDPFFTTKAPGKGVGLGLSIVYKIIKDHKGLINVMANKDRGTKVTILLPIKK